jgi:hypothetical protein
MSPVAGGFGSVLPGSYDSGSEDRNAFSGVPRMGSLPYDVLAKLLSSDIEITVYSRVQQIHTVLLAPSAAEELGAEEQGGGGSALASSALAAGVQPSGEGSSLYATRSKAAWRAACARMRGGIEDVAHRELPVNLAVLQEGLLLVERARKVHVTCVAVSDALDGTVVMTDAIERDIKTIASESVPVSWQSGAPGETTSLSSWLLAHRRARAQLESWVAVGEPGSVALGLLTRPGAFLLAVQQRCARTNSKSDRSARCVVISFSMFA